MRNLKKFLAMALAMLMLIGSFSVFAFDDTKDDDKHADAISLLTDLQVIRGHEDGTFKPDDDVTRWQMALMMAKLRTGKVEDNDSRWKTAENTTTFKDVEDYQYFGSIGYCYGNDIILGTSETTFDPTSNILFKDALTMAVRALGYASGDDKATMNNGYPWTFIDKAVAIGLDENLEDVGYEQALTRAQTAQLLYNCLTAAKKDGGTLAKASFNLTQATIVLTATTKANIVGTDVVLKNNYVQFRILDEYGQLSTATYHCQASELGITDAAEKYLFNSYNVLTQNNFETFVKVNKVEAETTAKVVKANSGKITIDGTTYKLVDKYTFLNNKPTNKYTEPEIIVLNELDSYKLMTSYTAETAYPELVLFDDNNDGSPDRALYKEYEFGRYQSTTAIRTVGTSTTRTVLQSPTIVGESVAAGDNILYAYNSAARILYVKEKAAKVSGIVGALDTSKGTITIGGVAYPVGIKNLPGAYTVSDLTTKLHNKNATVYTIDGKVVFFTDYANSSKFVVYDSYVGLNQLGYLNVYAYVQNNVKEVITVSSVNFKTYQNYYNGYGSVWFDDFLNWVGMGQVFVGTVDLNGYYDLTEFTSFNYFVPDTNTTAGTIRFNQYTTNKISTTGLYSPSTGSASNASSITVTANTVYFVYNPTTGSLTVRKGISSLPNTANNPFITVNPGGYAHVTAAFVYVYDGAFDYSSVILTGDLDNSNTLVYIDSDITLVTKAEIAGIAAPTYEYTYANAVDMINGGLLSYNIVTYQQNLKVGSFYMINDGVVVGEVVPNTTTDGSGQPYIFYNDAYRTQAGTTSGTGISAINYDDRTVSFSGAVISAFRTPVLYVKLGNNIKNTDASNITPKDFASNAVLRGAIIMYKTYFVNPLYMSGNFVIFADYKSDFDSVSYPSRFVRQYSDYPAQTNLSVTSSSTVADSFVEYICYSALSVGVNLRRAAGVGTTGVYDITNIINLFDSTGKKIDLDKYGLKFEIMDNLTVSTSSAQEQVFIKVTRNPLQSLDAAYNGDIKGYYYITYSLDGTTVMMDKVELAIAGISLWSNNSIVTSVTATSGAGTFVAYVDLGKANITLEQAQYALSNYPLYLYQKDSTGNYQKWSSVMYLGTPVQITGTIWSFTFSSSLNFTNALPNYAFAIGLPITTGTASAGNALTFAVA